MEDDSRAQSSAERTVRIPVGSVVLEGSLVVPADAVGVVLFAHGSGSGRHSPRNRAVANVLQAGRIGTLLIDLLTEKEEEVDQTTRHLRFDIPLLAERLTGAIDWLGAEPMTASLPIGLFGASTGGGAALLASVARPEPVRAVVSRGGRPDLADDALPEVIAPTLLIVGGLDDVVIALNQVAMEQMRCEKELRIVPGATHLFEEPGTLEQVADLARDWFSVHLSRTARL
ncbi:MAG TPA: alpha/beta family hydrolase [Thermomicrobiales bacterium]|nr:alpha/beta family hydrolase [Thermomicrobiales bacterium]